MKVLIRGQTFDRVCMVYIQCVIHGLVWGSFLIIFPWMINDGGYSMYTYLFCNVYLAFVYFNLFFNMCKVMTVNTTTAGKILPAVAPKGWKYCEVCQANYPPRAYHCSTCNICILKRDHHCNFAGKCVGYFTYRYFIFLIIYSALACLIISITSCHFVWSMLGEVTLRNVATSIMPIFMFMFGGLDIYTTLMALLSFLSWFFLIFTTLLVVWHSKHVFFNMTTFERRHNISKYDLDAEENMKQIFGLKWRRTWISPFISSPLEGDGLEFETKRTFESSKYR